MTVRHYVWANQAGDLLGKSLISEVCLPPVLVLSPKETIPDPEDPPNPEMGYPGGALLLPRQVIAVHTAVLVSKDVHYQVMQSATWPDGSPRFRWNGREPVPLSDSRDQLVLSAKDGIVTVIWKTAAGSVITKSEEIEIQVDDGSEYGVKVKVAMIAGYGSFTPGKDVKIDAAENPVFAVGPEILEISK